MDPRLTIDEMGYSHVLVGGVVYAGFAVESAILELQREFELRESDIVIATYPKCGTTWMQQIVLTLLFGGDTSKVPEPMLQAPWLESMVSNYHHWAVQADLNGECRSLSELKEWDGSSLRGEGPPGRRVFKTHAPAQLAPWIGGPSAFKGKRKAIVVARNPKDACVSLFHHTQDGGPSFNYWGDFDHFVEKLFLKGNVESGCFWKWHAGWEKAAAENTNILWISFEEMKADPVHSVRKIAAFLEVPCSDEVVKNVVGASTFEVMKSRFEEINQERFWEGKRFKANHIRRGGVGTWREELYGPLHDTFEAAHAAKSAELGLKFEWDFGEAEETEATEEVCPTKRPRTS